MRASKWYIGSGNGIGSPLGLTNAWGYNPVGFMALDPRLAPGGIVMARLLTGQNIVARNPLVEIQQLGNRPVFVVHGTADKRVAVHHSQQLEAAAAAVGANVKFWYVPGADHVRAAAVAPDEFEKRLVDFFCGALVGCK